MEAKNIKEKENSKIFKQNQLRLSCNVVEAVNINCL
jgi:hypothetical protein